MRLIKQAMKLAEPQIKQAFIGGMLASGAVAAAKAAIKKPMAMLNVGFEASQSLGAARKGAQLPGMHSLNRYVAD